MFWQKTRVISAQFAGQFKNAKFHLQIIKNRAFGKKISVDDKTSAIKKNSDSTSKKTRSTYIATKKSSTTTNNPEFAWILSNSENLKVIKVPYKNDKEKSIKTINKSQQETSKIPVIDHHHNVKNEPQKSKDNTLLPRSIIKHLLEFPLYEVGKKVQESEDDDSKVLTISFKGNKNYYDYPSVTKVLYATMSDDSKMILERWKSNMIEKLGVRGFEIHQAELLENGKLLHSMIMSHLSEKPYQVPDKIKKAFDSVDKVMKEIDQVKAIESHVVHSRLLYKGIVDCIASYRGELCLIDWKKSDKPKDTISATYDAPLQVASYIGAVNSDPNYPFQIKKGLIVVAYTNGEPAKVHEVNEDLVKMYWNLWLQRLQEYHVISNPSQQKT